MASRCLSLSLYICMYIYIYIYIYIYVSLSLSLYIYIYIYIYMCVPGRSGQRTVAARCDAPSHTDDSYYSLPQIRRQERELPRTSEVCPYIVKNLILRTSELFSLGVRAIFWVVNYTMCGLHHHFNNLRFKHTLGINDCPIPFSSVFLCFK